MHEQLTLLAAQLALLKALHCSLTCCMCCRRGPRCTRLCGDASGEPGHACMPASSSAGAPTASTSSCAFWLCLTPAAIACTQNALLCCSSLTQHTSFWRMASCDAHCVQARTWLHFAGHEAHRGPDGWGGGGCSLLPRADHRRAPTLLLCRCLAFVSICVRPATHICPRQEHSLATCTLRMQHFLLIHAASGLTDDADSLRASQAASQLRSASELRRCAGHSLGGALATLAAHSFATAARARGQAPAIACYTFGAPRTGNVTLAAAAAAAAAAGGPPAWH